MEVNLLLPAVDSIFFLGGGRAFHQTTITFSKPHTKVKNILRSYPSPPPPPPTHVKFDLFVFVSCEKLRIDTYVEN